MPKQKLPSTISKAEKLGRFEEAKLRRSGRRDGHHGLPKQDEDGKWTSPQMLKEAGVYNEFCIFTWSEVQAKHENNHKEMAKLCREIPILKEQLGAHIANAPPPPDLTVRLKGEEKHSDYIIQNRRQREYEKRHSSYFSKLRQLESKINENYRQLAEFLSVIQAAEKTARMLCERVAGTVMQRITIYWTGALSTHPKFKMIPSEPEITLKSDAESEYFSQNKQAQEEAKRLLTQRQTINTINNETEG